MGGTIRRLAQACAKSLGALAIGLLAASAVQAQTPPAPTADQVAQTMGRGLNVLGYDALWNDPSKARFHIRDFQIIRDGGFKTIRVNLQAMSHMDADNRLDPQWLATLDWVVRESQKAGLDVILDEHDYEICGRDVGGCRPKLMAFWRQVSERYKDAPPSVLFEILNEPDTQVTADVWNSMLAEALGIIRQTNPTRTVVIGPVFWNSFSHLGELQLPTDDHNILVTVHYYLPMTFTHQGASWVESTKNLSGITWGSPEEYARLNADFDTIAAWSKANNRPIFLGEFGAYDKGDMASRDRYVGAVARAAEARGFPWAYWQFDSNFLAYDLDHDHWIEPIHKALVP